MSGNRRYCNTQESGLNRSTAVGLYPAGVSAQGVFDLVGNVREWCMNKYLTPEGISIDSSCDERMVRGGSWMYFKMYAGSTDRYFDNVPPPDLDFVDLGFRLVCVSPSADL